MKILRALPFTICCCLTASSLLAQSDRLYGKITTREGKVLEGFIRWGNNEVGWVDLLNGSLEIPEQHANEVRELRGEARREVREIAILGFVISSFAHRRRWR